MNEESFFSIDRLVEFGMGLAVAQQMVQTMNQSMKNMYIPGAMNTMQPIIQQSYYVIIDNQQSGPYSEQEIRNLIAQKKISKETYMWRPGLSAWEKVEKLPEILKLVALTPPPFVK